MLVAVGGAMVGGARLALAPQFRPDSFWAEVRRYGVSVVFYAGDMLRELLHTPSYRGEQYNPIRLFVGSGMRADTERRLLTRFGNAKVLEYYASAEGPGLLANSAARKVGAFGKPPENAAHLLIAAYDFGQGALVRDEAGLCLEAGDDEPGVLLGRVDQLRTRQQRASNPGYARTDDADEWPFVRDVQAPGDRWYLTGEVMRRDPQGDYWPLDRVKDVIHTSLGLAFTRPIEDVLYELPDVRVAMVEPSFCSRAQARASTADARGSQQAEAFLVMHKQREPDPALLTRLIVSHLAPNERPRNIYLVSEVALTDGQRPVKGSAALRSGALAIYHYESGRTPHYVRSR
jgi:acyl-CoA synthetase (AMP-forming)/AMP-acid ligase II